MPNPRAADLRLIFKKNDLKGAGFIDREVLVNIARAVLSDLGPEKVEQLVNYLIPGSKGNEAIQYEAFIGRLFSEGCRGVAVTPPTFKGLPGAQLDDLQAAFHCIDRNGNGLLEKQEVLDALREADGDLADLARQLPDLQPLLAVDTWESAFRAVDTNSDGVISWFEFLQFFSSPQPGHKAPAKDGPGSGGIPHEDLVAVFACIDANSDGALDKEEVLAALRGKDQDLLAYCMQVPALRPLLAPGTWQHAFRTLDTNLDGKVSWHEFCHFFGVAGATGATMAVGAAGGARVIVAQWNLAGINSNAFEFAQAAPQADAPRHMQIALRFVSELSAAVAGLLGGVEPTSKALAAISGQTLAQLLAPLGKLAKSSPLAARVLESAPDATVENFLRDAHMGNRALGWAQNTFTNVGWSLMRLTSDSAADFMRVYREGDEAAFWSRWLASVEESYPQACELVQVCGSELALLAGFEAILFRVARCVLQEEDAGTKYGSSDEFCSAIATFVKSMCVEMHAKASGVVQVIDGLHLRCCPDVICLQEFNQQWLKDPAFARSWDRLLRDYDVFCPSLATNPHMMVQLLVRKAGTLTVDAQASSRASQLAASAVFLQSLRPRFAKLFGDALGAVMYGRLVSKGSPLATRLALAVCNVVSSGPVLVASAHATSDGTDNRAIVAAAQHLAEAEGYALLLALDANSAADFKAQDVAKGAAGQRDFFEFLSAQGIRHCFAHLEPDVVADPRRFHTVAKTRTFLQCQIHKAGKADMSAKDFVLATGQGVKQFDGRRMNTTAWLRRPSNAIDIREFPDEKDLWVKDITMPTPDFVSDHALVIAQACM